MKIYPAHYRISLFERFITYFVILSFILLIPKNVNASWLKETSNPIIKSSNPPWNQAQNPSVVTKSDDYLMVLEVNNQGWKLTQANSSKDKENWTVSNTSIFPYLSSQWDSEHSNPSLIYNPDLQKYQVWFTAFNSANWQAGSDRYRLGYGFYDGTSWNKYTDWVLIGEKGKWDAGGIARGLSVVYLNGTYHLWYTGTDERDLTKDNYWRIGYATSTDGIEWHKQNNGNPVIEPTKSWELTNIMYPHVIYENGTYKMWYGASPHGIPTQFVYATSTDGIHWNKDYENPVMERTPDGFDNYMMSSPFVIHEDNIWKMWYSGHDKSKWSIGFATNTEEPKPLPKPTPFEPVVIVPGIFSSWNQDAILHSQKNPTSPWTLLPFVKEYKGIIDTLKTLGYEEGKNLFVWNYDWRKPIQIISQNFNQFIESTVKPQNPERKIQLVGHSLGGLVGRTWTQADTHKDTVHHLVSVASPNRGTIQPYPAWEGGQPWPDNTLMNLAMYILIQLNRRSPGTTRQLIQETYPVLQDLLPTEPYLKQANGTFIGKSQMKTWNTWLETLNTSAPSVYPLFDAIQGSGFSQTPLSYIVSPPSWLDKSLGNWIDGKPTSMEFADGDSIVPLARASFSDDPFFSLTQNHSNTIASKDGVKKILERLEIPFTDDKISQGEATQIRPGLLFFIHSPATFAVTYNGQIYNQTDGILFIPNASSGLYTITVTGTGNGTYYLDVGQFTEIKTVWTQYSGTTNTGAQKTYQLSFDTANLKPDPITNLSPKEYLDEIGQELNSLDIHPFRPFVIKARLDLQTAKKALDRKQYRIVKQNLEQILLDFSFVRMMNRQREDMIPKTLAVTESVVNAYQAILKDKQVGIDAKLISRMITIVTNLETTIGKELEKRANKGANIKRNAILYSEALSYKKQAQEAPADELPRQYLLLFQSQLLFNESR